MNRRNFIKAMGIAGASCWTLPLLAQSGGGGKSPNFLFILSDDQGWSQVDFEMQPGLPSSKSDYLETPNIRRIAKEGIRFSSGYSPAAICTPTRRAIQCGTSAARSGSEFASWWPTIDKLTIPKALKSVNPDYRCAHFGKWGSALGAEPDEAGYDAGDGQTCNPQGSRVKFDKTVPHYIVDDPKRTESVTERAMAFMTENARAGTPFYTQVSYYAVHCNVELYQKTLDHFTAKGEPDRAYTRAFAGMLKEMDDGVGKLLDTLDELGIADNTYVVFMGDNGGLSDDKVVKRKQFPSANSPLSGQKWSIAEGGIRVPFVARGPGLPAGKASNEPVNGYDLLPTFYDLAGGTEPLPPDVDGGSLKPVFEDPENGRVQRPLGGLVFHISKKKKNAQAAIRSGDHKLLLTWNKEGTAIEERELYDVVNDVAEEHNLIEQKPELAAKLEKTLVDYLQSVDAPMSSKQYNEKTKQARGKG